MQIDHVDERDSTWERDDAVFRVYLFSGGGVDRSYSADTYDVRDADIIAVIKWAESQLGPDDRYAIALREGSDSDCGLVWLVGHDLNDQPSVTQRVAT